MVRSTAAVSWRRLCAASSIRCRSCILLQPGRNTVKHRVRASCSSSSAKVCLQLQWFAAAQAPGRGAEVRRVILERKAARNATGQFRDKTTSYTPVCKCQTLHDPVSV